MPRRTAVASLRKRNVPEASFKPHAAIQTETMTPSQITICGLTGGVERWLIIRFDLSKPPITFVQQAIDALPSMLSPAGGVPFFGAAYSWTTLEKTLHPSTPSEEE